MNKLPPSHSIVMLGATGAVGGQALKKLLTMPHVKQLSLLGRRAVEGLSSPIVAQHKVSIFDSSSYQEILPGHDTAICTLGVGQPSKVSKEDFLKIDKVAVLDFAKACKEAGVRHFELLASVGISSNSRSFYLRSKGELVDELKALHFERLSIFQPSMILTPTNRYGFSQALTLFIWPLIQVFLIGSLRKYKGIRVEQLGEAMALNIQGAKTGLEMLDWDDFQKLLKTTTDES